ncbi:nucleoside transporter-domain-containing protein [Radiomyces spectabilis]|uniref:nucleoside transporter-domain-containing protein n=1 Tax=Radiomyces spectabilis TaxID=64574 RepID=UPI0022210780|nr:nucleoside transporter-domain-containing protein [Radiomyces spectabilis]KAI8371566.1 nucleoside transporter-domain-containing protein [Radiomyces spectabilis]
MIDFWATQFNKLRAKILPSKDSGSSEPLLRRSTTDDSSQFSDVYQDSYGIVYWVFFIYGIAMLLPWNVFITASEYFAKRFQASEYDETFQNYFSITFTVSNLLVFATILWRQSETTTFHIDVYLPVIINAIVFAVMCLTVQFGFSGTGYFWMILGLLVVTGASTSLFQASVFAEASRFPYKYMQAVMSGQGVAGVAVAVSSIVSALAGSTTGTPDPSASARSALIYFLSAFGITLAAFIGRLILSQQPFYTHQIRKDVPSLSDDMEEEIDARDFLASEPPFSVMDTVRKSTGLIFAVGYIFMVTLAVFPSITALIKSVRRHDPSGLATPNHNRFFDDDIFVAFHFLLFNVGDWVGRTMPIIDSLRTFNVKALVTMSVARTLFIPAFLLCNVVVSDDRRLPVLFGNDLAYFIIVWLFAVTNGWMGSLTMMAAPQQSFIRTATEKSVIGTVMSFSLVLGLAIGGGGSFFVRWLV